MRVIVTSEVDGPEHELRGHAQEKEAKGSKRRD